MTQPMKLTSGILILAGMGGFVSVGWVFSEINGGMSIAAAFALGFGGLACQLLPTRNGDIDIAWIDFYQGREGLLGRVLSPL